MYFRASVFLLTFILCGLLSVVRAQTTRAVDTTVDNGALTACNNVTPGDCSLRGAIAASAASGDTINFSFAPADPNCTGGVCTITLGGTELLISKSLTINGPAANSLIISGNNSSRVFFLSGSITVVISGMTITGGSAPGNSGGGLIVFGSITLTLDRCLVSGNSAGVGGGIWALVTSTVTVSNSTIANNSAAGNGAINTNGVLFVTNSTISGNTSSSSGAGGIALGGAAEATIINSTITNNLASTLSGNSSGLVNGGVPATLRNTIVAGNQNNTTTPDIGGSYISAPGGGNNLIGNVGGATGFTNNVNGDKVGGGANPIIAPRLSALQNNGGPTPTHAVLTGSGAINGGNSCVATNSCSPAMPAPLTTDQRGTGFPRSFGTAVDIGAVESLFPTAASVTVAGRVVSATGAGVAKAHVTLTDVNGETRTALTGPFGYYRFDDVRCGEAYVVGVVNKRYLFAPRVIIVMDEINDLDLWAEP